MMRLDADGPEHTATWHAFETARALRELESDAARGLDAEEVARRLERVGPNELPAEARRSLTATFVAQLQSPLIYLLLFASVVAFALGHRSDALVIAVVVLLNATIGAFQEGRAERALQALRRLAVVRARVVRAGNVCELPARELVPGDLILLEAGDAVPADARVVEAASLQVSEAALTGESLPVAKQALALPLETPLSDRTNMLFTGTYVTTGRGRGVVTATGRASEVGEIATLAQSAQGGATPLEKRVAQLGSTLVKASGFLFALILAVGLLRGISLSEIAMLAISQVVGMVPEGLPVAMTIALATGVQRMARRNVVVRRLTAVETLGSTTVICTDKTGTLTRNEMTVTELVTASGRALTVTGEGYGAEGVLLERGRPVELDDELRALLEAAVLCNDAQLRSAQEGLVAIGDPTELALLAVAMKGGLTCDLRDAHPRVNELPFDPGAKLMATEHRGGAGSWVVVKGAPEELLGLAGHRGELRAQAERLAGQGLRVLAFARAEGVHLEHESSFAALRGRLRVLGLMAQTDPARPEVAQAVRQCRAAGIRPVMVTGDHKRTGQAIAAQLGIGEADSEAIDGQELDALSDRQLAERLDRVALFARVRPAQKLRIVKSYQQRGEVVAMTGDGVNDAPALVKADVGVAMGRTGTEVAKESAKIVLADDNFASIVAAVEEGRVVYRNIQKSVLLLLSTSLAEVTVLLLALVVGLPAPFTAVQILWNNLVTEGLITVNLVMEPAEGDEMRARPVALQQALLDRSLTRRMVMMSLVIVAVSLGWYAVRLAAGTPLAVARTETFTLLAVCEWFNVLNCRSGTRSALRLDLLRNPWLLGGLLLGNALHVLVIYWRPLGDVFYTVPIDGAQVLQIGALGSLVLWAEELRKWRARRVARASSVR